MVLIFMSFWLLFLIAVAAILASELSAVTR